MAGWRIYESSEGVIVPPNCVLQPPHQYYQPSSHSEDVCLHKCRNPRRNWCRPSSCDSAETDQTHRGLTPQSGSTLSLPRQIPLHLPPASIPPRDPFRPLRSHRCLPSRKARGPGNSPLPRLWLQSLRRDLPRQTRHPAPLPNQRRRPGAGHDLRSRRSTLHRALFRQHRLSLPVPFHPLTPIGIPLLRKNIPPPHRIHQQTALAQRPRRRSLRSHPRRLRPHHRDRRRRLILPGRPRRLLHPPPRNPLRTPPPPQHPFQSPHPIFTNNPSRRPAPKARRPHLAPGPGVRAAVGAVPEADHRRRGRARVAGGVQNLPARPAALHDHDQRAAIRPVYLHGRVGPARDGGVCPR